MNYCDIVMFNECISLLFLFKFIMNKNVHYHPLLHDTDTDSDVDIYDSNLKSKYDRNAKVKRLTKFGVGFVILAAIVFAVVYATIHMKKSNREFHIISKITKPVFTDCGLVTGTKETVQGKVAYTFKGIPYAKPPTGELRWRAPVQLSDNVSDCWKDVYAANMFGTQCIQGGDNDSEDCLFLNVFTPSLVNTSNLPVFVWIHGGYLMNGNGSQTGYHPDSEFVTSMNVVGVSMNYRLNAFGFLTLEELWVKGESYGNYGLMDQILALKWVQKNIRNFGGNPNLVTVAGQSSGGTSIFGLLASRRADGLFHRAIPMSGSPNFEMSYKNASEDNFKFVELSKCKDMGRGSELRKCLYSMTPIEVVSSIPIDKYPSWGMSDLIDFPMKGQLYGALVVVDDIIVKVPPKYFTHLKIHKNVSILIGNTAQEAGFGPKHQFNAGNGWNKLHSFLKDRLDDFNETFVGHVWNNLYANGTYSNSYNMSAQMLFETMTTDVRCTCPTNKLAKDFSTETQRNKIYRYIVEYGPEKAIRLPFIKHTIRHAFHAWDALALFGFKAFLPFGYVITQKDQSFMKNLRKSLRWFILHGNLDVDKWEVGQTGVYQSDGEVHAQHDYHARQCQFWNDKQNGFLPYAWIN